MYCPTRDVVHYVIRIALRSSSILAALTATASGLTTTTAATLGFASATLGAATACGFASATGLTIALSRCRFAFRCI